MAPTKRQTALAAANAARAAKRRKGPTVADAALSRWHEVQAGFGESIIPSSAKQLLLGMLPDSLAVPVDERHKYQVGVVDIVAGVFADVESQIKKAIHDADAKVKGIDDERERRKAAVEGAEGVLQNSNKVLSAKKKILAADAVVFKGSRAEWMEASDFKKAAEEKAEKLTSDQSNLKALDETMVTPIVEGAEPAIHSSGEPTILLLQRRLPYFGVDETLLESLPSVAGKEFASRGQFDKMVLQQLQEMIMVGHKTIAKDLAQAKETQVKQDKAEKICADTLATARDKQSKSANVYCEADEAQRAAKAKLDDANRSLEDLDGEVQQAADQMDTAEARLISFQTGPLSAFTELREGSKSADVEENEEEALAEEEDKAAVEAEEEDEASAAGAETAEQETAETAPTP